MEEGDVGDFCPSPDPSPSTFPTGWLLRLCKSDAIGHTPCDAPVSILIVGLSVLSESQKTTRASWALQHVAGISVEGLDVTHSRASVGSTQGTLDGLDGQDNPDTNPREGTT